MWDRWSLKPWRSLNMAPIDIVRLRPTLIVCDRAILHHFRVIWRWLNTWSWNLGQRLLKVIRNIALFDRPHTHLSSVVTMSVYCTVCEKSEWSKDANFYPPCIKLAQSPRIFAQNFNTNSLVPKLFDGAKILPKSSNLCVACVKV